MTAKQRSKAGWATTKYQPTLERLGLAARHQKHFSDRPAERREKANKARLKKNGHKTLWEQSQEDLGITDSNFEDA